MIAGHVLVGHGRLRITEMVSEDPLIVKVDHLKDKPYSSADGPNLPTALDLLSTISMNRVPFIELIRRLDFSRLADHGAAISNGANYLQLQEVLAELNVHKRLKLALDLVKEQTDFTRLESQKRLVLSKIGTRMALEESGLEDLGSHSVVKVLTATDTPTKWSRLLDWISDLLSI
ncbi:unnamed protein product [Linum tenue]|uniref:Lon N-terminal domain-containing protein n=1 Tax=Linum tenue TaxID=586396 RepID=A0AAV0R4K8_9ROSI|nr:unnamed protein product [Linum tenue]